MRILFLSQVLPYPLDAGPKTRSYFVLRHLVQSHEVTLLTFVRDSDRPEDIAHLTELCHEVHTVPMRRSPARDAKFLAQSLLTQQPFLIIRDQVPEMIDKVRQLVATGSFDVVHADQLWMAQYALAPNSGSSGPNLVLDQHNAVHLIPKRLSEGESNPVKRQFLAREAQVMTTYEVETCKYFDHVVWVTEEDRCALAAWSDVGKNKAQTSSSIIPICTDPTLTSPVERTSDRQRVTFLGGLHWPPNVQGVIWFATDVLPRVRAEIPDAVLTVIGKSPPRELEGEGIEVTGYVTDLMPYLAETGAFIVPLHAGGGMRVKILDAWGWGLPVVSTTIGAEGIRAQDGNDILIADTAETFAEAVVRVLRDPALAQRLSENGRQTVLEAYDWRVIYSAWDEVYRSLERGDYAVRF